MNRLIFFIALIVTLFSCSKKESENFAFEKTWQTGNAEDVIITADTMYAVAGSAQGVPFLIKLNRSGSRTMEFVSENNGSFTSLIEDTSGFYACGHSDNNLIISRVKPDGSEDWTVVYETTPKTARAVIVKNADNSYLVAASCDPDSIDAASFDMIEVDRDGNILSETNVQPGFNIAVNDIAVESSGNIYLAIAKSESGGKSKASVAELSPDGNFIWETELYNNTNFEAACLSIEKNDNGNLYLTGRTELKIEDNTLENSFLAALDPNGNILWKEYLENSNRGVDMVFDDLDRVHMLNRNCFIINILGLTINSDQSRVKTFEVCDPYQTGAMGSAIQINPDNDYILCGEKSGKVYYALRKGEQEEVPLSE